MRYGSVCSGIEAATVAWHSLGWEPAFFSEIEKFPRQVLAHHYPNVPLHGDFTTIGDDYGSIDLLVGGTPCQSFSIAGLRKGLDDERGNLALEYLRLAQRKRPKWIVWENVPGVLSSNGGRDFGSFLGALAELGYGFAYRVLDAQYFGVAQRRRRVFVVGYLGDWRRAAAVLFERESLSGHPAPTVKKGGPWWNGSEISQTLDAVLHKGQMMPEKNRFPVVVGCQLCSQQTAPYANTAKNLCAISANVTTPSAAVLGQLKMRNMSTASTTASCGHAASLRRITPVECERLQGFPDGYTNIMEKTPDGPRYKALGNSMAVPVMNWIGKRIQECENETV